MQCKKACLVINPRAGENLAKITDLLAVLAAAGWKTDLAIKEYGGQTMELATEGAKKDFDLLIAYGGDGTLNQVVNGVMNTKGHHSIVGVIPGGTANVWASEVGVPVDPVKAALSLVDSEARKVDIGHIEVESLTFPDTAQHDGEQAQTEGKKKRKKKAKATSKARHYFLLMAGLGIDAAIMSGVSKPLKYKIGPLAVGLSAAKELPSQKPFPIEIWTSDDGQKRDVLWKGEALQIVIGNTRKYADVVEMTPHAYIDDGVLDVCVITAGDPLSTLQQITSLLLRRKPDNLTAEYFHGAHLSMSVPASIDLQLDGSTVKLKDYLSKSDWKALQQTGDTEQVMVNYQFDSMPHALGVAIPRTYDDALFENAPHEGTSQTPEQQQADEEKSQLTEQHHINAENDKRSEEEEQKDLEQVKGMLDHGRQVTVIGAAPNPAKKDTYIIAGTTPKLSTGEEKPVAVCIDDNTTISKRTGEQASPAIARELQEGGKIVVEGKKSKRGVIRAQRVVVM